MGRYAFPLFVTSRYETTTNADSMIDLIESVKAYASHDMSHDYVCICLWLDTFIC